MDITFNDPPPFDMDADAFADNGQQHHVVTHATPLKAKSGPYKYTITVRYKGQFLAPLDPEVNVMP